MVVVMVPCRPKQVLYFIFSYREIGVRTTTKVSLFRSIQYPGLIENKKKILTLFFLAVVSEITKPSWRNLDQGYKKLVNYVV